jgi:hypothetical protein
MKTSQFYYSIHSFVESLELLFKIELMRSNFAALILTLHSKCDNSITENEKIFFDT